MAVVLVEGITDRIALEAVAAKLGLDLAAGGVEIVPIGGAQAIRRAAAQYDGERVVGLCDVGEERWFRRVLGDATYVCSCGPRGRADPGARPRRRRGGRSG